jgi:hypothetical protein
VKTAIDTWDLFDTLAGRFLVDPLRVFDLVEEVSGVTGYAQARQQAQRVLDGQRKPYTLHRIYRCMEELFDISPELSGQLISLELSVEMDQLIPVRRQIERVAPLDLIVSDMYLSVDQVQDILRRICGLHTARPPVVSNWGKATGSVWHHLSADHIIRIHHGDNPRSDHMMPHLLGIRTEMIADTKLTDWEQRLADAGPDWTHLAHIVREVRLRAMPLFGGGGVLRDRRRPLPDLPAVRRVLSAATRACRAAPQTDFRQPRLLSRIPRISRPLPGNRIRATGHDARPDAVGRSRRRVPRSSGTGLPDRRHVVLRPFDIPLLPTRRRGTGMSFLLILRQAPSTGTT